ncbi:MAG: hypothetical protein REH83_01645 [Rickettsiella sp.]|nr:hypothetical protein [Rickettsiella sp.]
MPKKLIDSEKITSLKSDSVTVDCKHFSYYSLSQDKKDKEKEMASLNSQYNLAVQLLSKVTDKIQHGKLVAKKKQCLEKKVYLEQVIFDIAYIQVISKECILFFEFISNFYNFNMELFDCIDNSSPFISKKLHTLKEQEEMLVRLSNIDVYLKNELSTLKYDTYKPNFDKSSNNFFESFEKSKAGFFCKFLVFSEKIHDSFIDYLLSIKKDSFNLKNLETFFKKYFYDCSLPSEKYILVGSITFFLHIILFRFMASQPVTTSFVKLKQFIHFHTTILSLPTDENILKNVISLQEKFSNLEEGIELGLEEKISINKDDIDKHLILFKETYKKLLFIRDSLNDLFSNKNSLRYIAILDCILKPEKKDELLSVFKVKTGLDYSLIKLNKIDLRNIKTNSEVMNYFFCTIYIENTRDSLYNIIKTLISFFPIEGIKNIPSLAQLTIKDFVTLAYFSLSTFLYMDFIVSLEQLEKKLNYSKLCALNIFLLTTLKVIDNREKIFKSNEDIFFKKKYSNESSFLVDKKTLLDELTLLLSPVEDLILTTKEFQDSNLKVSHEFLLKDLHINIEFTQFAEFLNSNENNLGKLMDYLKDFKEKLKSKKESIEKFFLPTIKTKLSAIKENKTAATASVEFNSFIKIVESVEAIFDPMTSLSKHLISSLQFIENPEGQSNKHKKNKGTNERFFSGIGQIRSSINLIAEALFKFHKTDRVSKINSNLIYILKTIHAFIEEHSAVLGEKIEKNKRFCLFKESVANCLLSIESIIEMASAITKKCEVNNNRMADVLDRFDSLDAAMTSSIFFKNRSQFKELEKIFTNKYFFLKKQIYFLERLLQEIRSSDTKEFINFYKVIAQNEAYEKIVACIKQQPRCVYNNSIHVTKNKLGVPTHSQNLKKNVNKTNNKSPVSQNYLLEKNMLLELNKFNDWNINNDAWKLKRDADLLNIFNIIEECSLEILNRTASSFLKILHFYKEELTDKYVEFKEQQLIINTCAQKSDGWQVIKDYMLHSAYWFDNVLARIGACIDFLYESAKKYRSICMASAEAPNLQTDFFYASQLPEFNPLLTAYLTLVDKYTKTREKLDFEQKNLAKLNRKFVAKIFQAHSLEAVEQEVELLSEFNKKLSEVNYLQAVVKQTLENKQQIKNKLTQLIGPDMLNFYMSRINPSDMQGLEFSPQFPFERNYVYSSSNFYCLPSNISVSNEENCVPNLVYYGFTLN